PGAYAIYGYEAASVALDALNRSCGALTREAVLANLLGTKNFGGLLGPWDFDANGDTTLTMMSGHQVKGGTFEFVRHVR
ncbi:MAG TPA: branched-chain amino acid ABC transporter substrate-binding protein, partial [Herpetosiphonaceae bacterium]